jgi:predicted permease
MRHDRDMTGLGHDLRFAIRMLLKTRASTVVAVVALAIGIGGTTVMFSAVDGILLRPLPYPEAQRLVRVWERWGSGGIGSVSWPNFQDWRARAKKLELLSAISGGNVTLVQDGRGERVQCSRVTADLFTLLGARPRLGRAFAADDFVQGGVAILSDALWREHFAASPDVLGKTVRLSDGNFTIVGVLPASFRDEMNGGVYLPFVPDEQAKQRGSHFLYVLGRSAAGATAAQAQTEMDAIARALQETYPDSNKDRGILVRSLQESLTERLRPMILILFGAVVLVLLMVCANVANMLLARAAARRGELAVRLALGASRGRVVRQLLTESLLVGLIGGALGLIVSLWGIDGLRAILPEGSMLDVRLDAHALLFALGVALGSTIVFGLVPAVRAVAGDFAGVLKEDARTLSGARSPLRSSLVVVQVALSFAVVVSAALLGRSFMHLVSVDTGFDPRGVVTLQVSLPDSKDPGDFFPRVLERVRALPQVSAAGFVDFLPLSESNINGDFEIEGKHFDDPNRTTEYMVATPGYFETMRIPILRGRGILPSDGKESEKICVVNLAMARRYFGTDDPIGQHLSIGWNGNNDWMRVVGVVADIKRWGLAGDDTPETFMPLAQQPFRHMALAVRGTGTPPRLIEAVRAEVRAADPEEAVYHVKTMDAAVADSLRARRLLLDFAGLFGVVALVVAALGIYGVLAVQVAQRTRELGIRMALGATPGSLRGMVVRQGARLALVGAGIGALAALALSSLLKSQLYGVAATDPLTYAMVATALVGVALVAAWIPARWATAIDPMVALRV